MKTVFKRIFSLTLSLIMAFSVLTLAASAESELEELIVYDLLKFDVDPETDTCRTIEVFFQNQFVNYDTTKDIVFLDEAGEIFAVCVPHTDKLKMYDLYSPDKSTFGVKFSPSRLYYLVIPEGAYYTNNGVLNAEFKAEYDGVNITSNNDNYTITDLGISNFLPTKYTGNILYKGKILFASSFKKYSPSNNTVILSIKDGNEYKALGTYHIIDCKTGSATIDFGKDGIEIDKYATYKIFVEYASITGDDNLLCAHSEYVLTGKKLIGLREDYPWLDLLISWFGADHWTVKAIVTILEVLSKIKLVDEALYKDIKN